MIEFVRTEHLKVGDRIANPLYDEMCRVLMKAGRSLTETAIRVIKQNGYKGVYIENNDVLRREQVPIAEPLVDDLKQLQLMNLLKHIYQNKNISRDFFDKQFMADKHQLHEFLEEIIDALVKAEEEGRLLFEMEDSRNAGTWIFFHSINVCLLSIGMAIKMGKSKTEIMDIALGAIYHDLGKGWFPDNLVNKMGLSESERRQLREHPEKMFRFLQKHNYSVTTLYAVWQHHEKINGTGYPQQLKGDKIVESARIVSCANIYDNMVNMNPYEGESFYQEDAIEYLSANAELDIDCLRALLQVVVPYPVGTKVVLSNGQEGIVVKNSVGMPLRPMLIVNKELVYMDKDEKYRNVTVKGIIK
uniref:HD-GYP domain-containing protein n=1 Tax=Agathobacter sp. TaxID=2021311 RepID=UPI0040568268